MDNTRANKIDRLLQKDLAIIFQQKTNTICQGNLVSVTEVRISPDLSIAKVYLSIFPVKEKEELLKHINEQNKQIRFELGKKIRHQLRKIPELKFFLDDTLDKIENIENLLKE
ncbi:MAG: 30S ribosome-binding factor RbfA [Bacteroidales bacterium]|jgi:ribosome-binding factor A|nr:30S ribosome-binding factor RbfA [Bacteroidales bacterium]